MDKIISSSLSLLGLSPKEIKFFLASFKLGPSSVGEIAREAKLERSTAYLISQELLDKGLLEQDFKQYGKKVFAAEPKKLLRIVSSKQRSLRRQEIELEESLPDMQSFYQLLEIRPRVKVYEGNSGLLAVWKDILSTKGEILVWTNQETDRLIFGPERHVNFIEERVKKGITARVLAVDNSKGHELKKLDNKYLRKTKLLPKKTNFSAETYIYDHKIAILDYKKDIIGIIIESEPIAASQKAIFEMNWSII